MSKNPEDLDFLLNMEMHTQTVINKMGVTRVPGGWLYSIYKNKGQLSEPVFVPEPDTTKSEIIHETSQ